MECYIAMARSKEGCSDPKVIVLKFFNATRVKSVENIVCKVLCSDLTTISQSAENNQLMSQDNDQIFISREAPFNPMNIEAPIYEVESFLKMYYRVQVLMTFFKI